MHPRQRPEGLIAKERAIRTARAYRRRARKSTPGVRHARGSKLFPVHRRQHLLDEFGMEGLAGMKGEYAPPMSALIHSVAPLGADEAESGAQEQLFCLRRGQARSPRQRGPPRTCSPLRGRDSPAAHPRRASPSTIPRLRGCSPPPPRSCPPGCGIPADPGNRRIAVCVLLDDDGNFARHMRSPGERPTPPRLAALYMNSAICRDLSFLRVLARR